EAVRTARRVRHRGGHPRDPATGAGAPAGSGNGARRERPGRVEAVSENALVRHYDLRRRAAAARPTTPAMTSAAPATCRGSGAGPAGGIHSTPNGPATAGAIA